MDSDAESSADEVDFDGVAEQALQTLGAAVQTGNLNELSLNVGLDADQLYLTGEGSNGEAFDTTAPPGVCRLDFNSFADGGGAPAPSASSTRKREVRGAPVRPVDDSKLSRREARKARDQHLDKWFGMAKRTLTPEMEKELKAIKLRANFDPKRFYKAQDSRELPKYFTFATEVGGGMAAAGVSPSAQNVTHKSGRSFLDTILRDTKAQEWTWKKRSEVAERGQASALSGHGRPKSGGRKAKATHRGGGWKKTKRS